MRPRPNYFDLDHVGVNGGSRLEWSHGSAVKHSSYRQRNGERIPIVYSINMRETNGWHHTVHAVPDDASLAIAYCKDLLPPSLCRRKLKFSLSKQLDPNTLAASLVRLHKHEWQSKFIHRWTDFHKGSLHDHTCIKGACCFSFAQYGNKYLKDEWLILAYGQADT